MSDPHERPETGQLQTSIDLRATIEEYEDEPDECTFYPDPVPRERETTAWISAKAGSFVQLNDHR